MQLLENIQAIPTDMLNEDTSFKVFLFFVIIVLIIGMGFLWRAKEKRDDYIREQDKANLTMLHEVTSAVKEVAATTDENKTNINTLKMQSQSILDVIKERLKSH